MSSDLNFYVFRGGQRQVPGRELVSALRESLSRATDEAGWTETLLRAGELECALLDAGAAEAEKLAQVTDKCAENLVDGAFARAPELLTSVPDVDLRELTVTTPEGFAYYALHPMQYADVADKLGKLEHAMVVGIRSIGTTLSAVTAAAFRKRGTQVIRFTVRPEGHPFDRQLKWHPAQAELTRSGIARGATFVVVDEGPGLSGSSFLSVAEALGAAGVVGERIVMVPGHAVDAARLRARDGEQRWKQFRCLPVGENVRTPDGLWVGAGEWRGLFLADEKHWPGAWTSLERAKFLSVDQRLLWKFEGLGPYGTHVRARALNEAGFGPRVVAEQGGFVGYELLEGGAAGRADLTAGRLQRMAAYCAFRAERFRCKVRENDRQDLETMLRVNFEREFGSVLPEECASLELVRPAICDAKMAPHEWLIAEDGRFLKLDAASHGDDHFFPGPCDIAWDLAGAIVEWDMDERQGKFLLRAYASLSGEDPTARIGNYLRAYAVFRFAWSRMAAAAMQGTPEEGRLMNDYRRYRNYVERVGAASAHR